MNAIDIERWARMVWDYHHMGHLLVQADAILVLGSHDIRVAERGAGLYLEGWAPLLIFSGGRGNLTAHWEETEAETFARAAARLGVPRGKMLLEDRSTNTGENLRFTRELLEREKKPLSRAILVQKPYMERRAWATCRKVWPELQVVATSPPIAFEDYPCPGISRDDLIHIMTGDLQRLRRYAEKGYQAAVEIPAEVWAAGQRLIEAGYTRHLLDGGAP